MSFKIWGIIMSFSGVFLFMSGWIQGDSIIYKLLAERCKPLLKENVHVFFQLIGGLITFLGLLITSGLIKKKRDKYLTLANVFVFIKTQKQKGKSLQIMKDFKEAFINWIKPILIVDERRNSDSENSGIEDFKEDFTAAVIEWIRPIFLSNKSTIDADISGEELLDRYIKLLEEKEKENEELKEKIRQHKTEIIDTINKKVSELKLETSIIQKNQQKIIEVSTETKNKINQLKSIFQNLSVNQEKSISDILESLKEINDSNLQTQLFNNELMSRTTEILSKISEDNLSNESKEKIKDELNRSDITLKHKLKFVIPLVFLKYESEIEFSNKQKLPKNWNEWKKLFFEKQ